MSNSGEKFCYPILIREHHLDTLGHVNNATYLAMMEEARWEFITQRGYGLARSREVGQGPVVLQINITFQKELRLRDEIVVESQTVSYDKKIFKVVQKLIRKDIVCCTAEFTMGLFDLKQRALILPTEEWLEAIGYNIA